MTFISPQNDCVGESMTDAMARGDTKFGRSRFKVSKGFVAVSFSTSDGMRLIDRVQANNMLPQPDGA